MPKFKEEWTRSGRDAILCISNKILNWKPNRKIIISNSLVFVLQMAKDIAKEMNLFDTCALGKEVTTHLDSLAFNSRNCKLFECKAHSKHIFAPQEQLSGHQTSKLSMKS